MTKYKVEKGVPLPDGNPTKYPWHGMEIGDSFLVKGVKKSTIATVACITGKRYGKKFATRSMSDGIRVWRVK